MGRLTCKYRYPHRYPPSSWRRYHRPPRCSQFVARPGSRAGRLHAASSASYSLNVTGRDGSDTGAETYVLESVVGGTVLLEVSLGVGVSWLGRHCACFDVEW